MSYQQPTTFDKIKMGFLMGGSIGATMGFLLGGFTTLVYGPGADGYLRSIGKQMLNKGAFFAALMSIGSVIRTQELENTIQPQFQPNLKRHPVFTSEFKRFRKAHSSNDEEYL